MTAQVTWDTFIPRPSEGPRIIHLSKQEADGVWGVCTVRLDAEIIVRDFGKLPGGGTTCDRLMENGRPLDGWTMDPEDRELQYWSHNTRGYEKRIRYDGTIIETIYTHRKDEELAQAVTAEIIGDELVFTTTEGKKYGIRIVPAHRSSMVNYIYEAYDQTFYTEHLLIHALNHGKTLAEVRDLMHTSKPWSLQCYEPFTRDHETGELIPSKVFDDMMDFAHSVGIIPKVRFDVRPYQPFVYPAMQHKYCIRYKHKTCDRKKNTGGCICCHQFVGDPEQKVDAKDMYNHKKSKKVPERYAEVCA